MQYNSIQCNAMTDWRKAVKLYLLFKEKLKQNNEIDYTLAKVDGGACCTEEVLLKASI